MNIPPPTFDCLRGLLLVLVFAGCSAAKHPLTGVVMFRGQPVADGYITFFPERTAGASIGAPIVAGQYRFDHVPHGMYRVLVSAPSKADGTGKKLLPATSIAATAPGNNQIHTVEPNQTSLDIAIQPK